ncbi:MAG: hypothetical protein HQ508_01765 [Candidatus Marinimicrobia bacterium]|nr:hypothetical protein [Candidatus Neomarinimicrobiota bacterium]
MKTFMIKLLFFSLVCFAIAQTDSTLTDSSMTVENGSTESTVTDTIAQNTQLPSPVEVAIADTLAQDTLLMSWPEMVNEDTLKISKPEMILVQIEPKPVSVAGLVSLGPLYYWSNDELIHLGLDSLNYISILNPDTIAVRANDCLDIVCHLLASSSSGVDYVFVSTETDDRVKVYRTDTKVVVIEVSYNEVASEFDAYLRDLAGSEYIETPPIQVDLSSLPEDTSAYDLTASRLPFVSIKKYNFRSMDELFTNPANLARDYHAKWSINLLPDFKVGIRNSVLTPGWYKKWWTTGGNWDASTKNEYLATLLNEKIVLNIAQDFHTLFGLRIGRVGFNISGKSHVKLILPGSIPATLIPVLPMEDWTLHDPIENGGLELETIPFVLKSTLSYAHPLSTIYGNVKLGAAVNMYTAAGYIHFVSDNLSITFSEDSVYASASGEAWGTYDDASGHLNNLDLSNYDPMNTLSDPTFGIDVGAIMDLYPMLQREIEVQISIRNIGAKYSWSGLKHEAWTFEQISPIIIGDDSLESFQHSESFVLDSKRNYDIDIPTVINLAAFYQPIPRIMLGAGIEKAFTEEVRFGYSPGLEYYYQLNYFAAKWVDFSYYHQTKYGDPVHTFGTGFHFGFLDTGFTFSLFNGLNSDAKGLGFGFRSSLHF